MSDAYPPMKSREDATLERQIMDSCIAKNDAEWWAMREIEKLREALVDIADPTTTAEERRQIACDALGWKTD